MVTGASEDGDSVDVAGRERPPRKDEDTRTDSIRSAWGVVKRAMHPQDPATGCLARGGHGVGTAPADHRTRTWVPVVEVSLAESWSHASLVDDL